MAVCVIERTARREGAAASRQDVDLRATHSPGRVEIRRGRDVVAQARFWPDRERMRLEMHTAAGHLPVATRAALLDAVFGAPAIAAADALAVTVPAGDIELIRGIESRFRTERIVAAGSTCLINATRRGGRS